METQMSEVIINAIQLKFKGIGNNTVFQFQIDDYRASAIKKKMSGSLDQVRLRIEKPFKPRTTGKNSQNAHLNGHIQQICQETGEDFDATKIEIKRRAIKRGYGFKTALGGDPVPKSESRASTIECGYLIDEAHEVAAFLNIRLIEND
jgi:hypothetical protein